MATTPTYINQRINNLQSQINNLTPVTPVNPTLGDILLNGNSAGTFSINMNSQDITSVDNIQVTTINGSAYPPVVPIPDLQQVLTAGNTSDNSINLQIGANTNTVSNVSVLITDGTDTSELTKYYTSFNDGTTVTSLSKTSLVCAGSAGLDFTISSANSLILTATDDITATSDNIGITQSALSFKGNNAIPNEKVEITKNTILVDDASTAGYIANPSLKLVNRNATVGNTNGVPSIETYKNGRNTVAGDVIYSQHHYALDAGSQRTEFGRIRTNVISATSGAEHGSVGIWCARNGGMNEVFTFNGATNDNNSLRPLDMNDNALLTTVGDLKLDASGSAGTGNVNITTKVGGAINLNSNVVMDNSEQFIQRNPAFTIYNNQTQSSINLVDISSPPITNQNTNNSISQLLTNDTTIQTLTNESYCNLQRVNKFDKTVSTDTERTDIGSNYISMFDINNPSAGEQVDINPTSIQFTSSGSASDSLSMYNDSADGGEINWSNTTGTNGLTITSSHSLNLISTASTFPIELDSDVINLKNTNTTTSVSNHNADIRATSTGLETTTFLKLQLNGADIWIPYFTTDPSI